MGINQMIEDFFKEVVKLKTITRQGWKEKLKIIDPESVADHTYSATVMAMFFSDLKGLNTEKIMRMALLHDLSESVTGDIIPNTISKNEKIRKENHAMKLILKNLPDKIANQYLEIWNDYQKNSSKEANLMHDIDRLEMAIQAKFYEDGKISKKKIELFYDTARNDIKDDDLRSILLNFTE